MRYAKVITAYNKYSVMYVCGIHMQLVHGYLYGLKSFLNIMYMYVYFYMLQYVTLSINDSQINARV